MPNAMKKQKSKQIPSKLQFHTQNLILATFCILLSLMIQMSVPTI